MQEIWGYPGDLDFLVPLALPPESRVVFLEIYSIGKKARSRRAEYTEFLGNVHLPLKYSMPMYTIQYLARGRSRARSTTHK